MNGNQRLLTVFALIAFVAIGWYHYHGDEIPDVRLPFFMLGVIYAGLFFLLANKKEKR